MRLNIDMGATGVQVRKTKRAGRQMKFRTLGWIGEKEAAWRCREAARDESMIFL